MDPAVVVDASVWVSWFAQQDVHHLSSDKWLTQYVALGGHLIGPVLLWGEVAGAISRRTGNVLTGRQSLSRLRALPDLQIVPVDQTLSLAAAQLAADLQIRGADAVYVALAQQLNIPLVTWDAEQERRPAGHIVTYTPDSYVF